MKRAAAGNAAGQDLSSLGDELSQAESILIINVLDLVRAEGANLLAAAGRGLGCAVSALLTLCGRAVFGSHVGGNADVCGRVARAPRLFVSDLF